MYHGHGKYSLLSSQDTINVATGTAGITSTATLSGNLQLNYTDMTVSGSITDSNGNTYGSFTLAVTNGNYVLTSAPSTGAVVGALAYTLAVSYPSDTIDPSLVSTSSKSVANNTTANTDNVPVTSTSADCFLSGTLIRTTRGDIAVEALAVGDVAITASGMLRRITWTGHRDMDLGKAAQFSPVRIAAHAFGPGVPARNLFLSPGHPILVGADVDHEGGHLVPIMCLINGTTIQRVSMASFTYWHIELETHDILLAEGLPAESYLQLGDRTFFTRDADTALTNPDTVPAAFHGRCRPVAIDGPVVEAERDRLDVVFAARLAAVASWPSADEALFGA